MDTEYLRQRVSGMFRPCTDMIKTDPKDIEQEKLDSEYNSALYDVLDLLKKLSNVNE